MKKVLIVETSVRPNSAGKKVAQLTKERFEAAGDDTSLVSFVDMPLPLFDDPMPPSADEFAPSDTNVQKWTEMVAGADTVVFVLAEYNASYSAVVKNAVDWIYQEWTDKQVAFIGYGWHKGSRVNAKMRVLMTENIKAKPIDQDGELQFMQDIDLDGAAKSDTAAEAIDRVVRVVNAK